MYSHMKGKEMSLLFLQVVRGGWKDPAPSQLDLCCSFDLPVFSSEHAD